MIEPAFLRLLSARSPEGLRLSTPESQGFMAPGQLRSEAARRAEPVQRSSLEDAVSGLSLTPQLRDVLRPLADEIEGLQRRVAELEGALEEERTSSKATERRLNARIQSLARMSPTLDDADAPPAAAYSEAASSMVLPPPGHPFWKQPDAPSVVVRMLTESEAGRLRATAQLEASLEARRALVQQLDGLREKQRALQSTLLALEMQRTTR